MRIQICEHKPLDFASQVVNEDLIGFNVPVIESLDGITLTPSLRSGHLIGINRNNKMRLQK